MSTNAAVVQPSEARPWLHHDGQGCPVDPWTLVDVKLRYGGQTTQSLAKAWQASKTSQTDWWTYPANSQRWFDIVGYRLSSLTSRDFKGSSP